MKFLSHLKPLKAVYQDPVAYFLEGEDQQALLLNNLLGQELSLAYHGEIQCCHCGRKIKKTFNQGYCYPCFKSLPVNDLCYVKPNLCHFQLGTCRSHDFGTNYCQQEHIVYLAVSSHLKVGITKANHQLTRWINQGAGLGMVIAHTPTRKVAGELEAELTQFISDKTNWRQMLAKPASDIDLTQEWQILKPKISTEFHDYFTTNLESITITYPVKQYPEKIRSIDLLKNPIHQGVLIGIKGQYLLFDNGVINLKKHTGFLVELSWN